MKGIFTDEQIEWLKCYTEGDGERKLWDRSYRYTVAKDDAMGIRERLYDWFEKVTEERVISRDSSLIIHRFGPGDWFGKHRDERIVGGKRRKWVCGFHLTDVYEGGEYQLYEPDETINKEVGIPYCFRSDRWHEIKPVRSGVRKSVVMFIHWEDLEPKGKMI